MPETSKLPEPENTGDASGSVSIHPKGMEELTAKLSVFEQMWSILIEEAENKDSVDGTSPDGKNAAAVNTIMRESLIETIKEGLDEFFKAYGITTLDAKREIFSHLYGRSSSPEPEAALLKSVPPTLQPRAVGRKFDADTIKAARQVVNRYNYQRTKQGRADFTDDERDAVRAAKRVLGTLRQRGAQAG